MAMKKIAVLSVLLIFLTSFAFAGTIDLPKTGQTECYDAGGTEIPCVGTGQDGEIQAGVAWPEPRFTDNGDDTMTDNLTGLIWASNGNIMPTRDPGWDTDQLPYEEINDGAVTWQHALDYVAKLNAESYLGFNDWRLPNVNELESLVNGAESNTATWLNTQGFTNVQASYHWSSTTHAYYGGGAAWNVYMWDGWVALSGKPCYYYVWPVRSGQTGSLENSVISLPQTGQTKCFDTDGIEIPCAGTGQDGEIQAGVAWPSPRFSDHGNTVTDNLTGLMWTKNANLPGDDKTWQQALDYVKGMNAGTYENFGYTDWRLPNRKEFHSLTDYSRYDPALPSGHPFTNVQGYYVYYWSSTTCASTTYCAWVVTMWDGLVSDGGKRSIPSYYYVWPVRSGQTGPLGDLDISVTKTASPDPVSVGNNLTYTVVVTNNGPETGTGVTLTDTLPSSVTYVSASSTKGTPTKSGNTVTCSIGTLSSGASATVTIVVTPTTAGTITNTASVTCNETDTNSSNNIATESTTVNALTDCSTWEQVIAKYQEYVAGQASWTDVIECYQEYAS